MIHKTWIPMIAAALLAGGCGTVTPTTPVSPTALDLSDTSSLGSLGQSAGSCAVGVGTTVNPLPALHHLQEWLDASIQNAASSLNCGQVRSLDAKLEVVTKSLDTTPPNFAAACGASTALVNEMQSLIRRGQLATPTFPPPVPGGPTNVLAAAEFLNQRWCDAARGVITGPRS